MTIRNQVIIVRHTAYGREDAYAAIRMAGVGMGYGLPSSLVLCDDGVWNAVRDQWAEAIEMPSNEEHLLNAIEAGARVYVDASSLEERDISPDDLVDGVSVAGCEELVQVILSHDAILPLCGGF